MDVTCLLYAVPPTPFSPTMGRPFSLGKYLRVPASWATEILFHVDVRDVSPASRSVAERAENHCAGLGALTVAVWNIVPLISINVLSPLLKDRLFRARD